MGKKKLDFEKAVARLEEIVNELESGDVVLERTIKLFEEGKRLGEECRRQLVEWEKKIQKIVEKEDGGIEMADFEEEAAGESE